MGSFQPSPGLHDLTTYVTNGPATITMAERRRAMPQITLQYTDNINQNLDFDELFLEVHTTVSEIAGIAIANCKSRTMKLERYYVARGEAKHAFVHLDIAVLEGRSVELKQEMGSKILDILTKYYAPSIDAVDLQLTVEIRDISRDFYFKFPKGTLAGGRFDVH
jgi:5-carboxymethyl-2-hydroxymuconate isomerase